MIDFNDKRVQQFGYLELRARQVVEGFITGLHKSPFHGFSVEFSEHRQYNPGESIRFIDWKLYGRTEKLFIKRFEEETNLRARIIFDVSPSMLFPGKKDGAEEYRSKYNFGIFIAAVLMQIARQQRDAIGLSLVADELLQHTQARSTYAHHDFLMKLLEQQLDYAETMPLQASNLVENFHQIAERIHRRSMVIIISDFLDTQASIDQILDSFQHFMHNKHEVILFHLMDKKHEMEFDFSNKPHYFIDLENKQKIKVRPHSVRNTYRQRFSEFYKNLEIECGKYGIDYIEADINQGLEGVLMPFFMKRLVLK